MTPNPPFPITGPLLPPSLLLYPNTTTFTTLALSITYNYKEHKIPPYTPSQHLLETMPLPGFNLYDTKRENLLNIAPISL